MISFTFLPFWQEFGIIIGGTILLFIFILRLEKKIRTKGDSNDRNK